MHRQIFLALPPGAVGRGQKVKYHLISITKPISKIIIQNFFFFFFIKHGHVAYQIDGDDKQNRMQVKILRSNW